MKQKVVYANSQKEALSKCTNDKEMVPVKAKFAGIKYNTKMYIVYCRKRRRG